MQKILVFLAGLWVATVTSSSLVQAASPEVITFKLSMSNVHAIKGERTILIDAGAKGDMRKLESLLAGAGVAWKDIAVVVVTHGHSDHAGLAAEIRRRSGAVVLLGKGDIDMAAAGHNDDLKPTNLMARLLKRFAIDPKYEAFKPDRVIEGVTRLDEWGIQGLVRPMPGHTPGSLVIELDDGRSFVGDMILGGYLGGTFMPQRPGEHYFHADQQRNASNIRTLLQGSGKVFYLGHGGPVPRESIAEAFAINP